MSKPAILITGVEGEIGQGLVEYFLQNSQYEIVTLDLVKRENSRCNSHVRFIQGSVLDAALMAELDQTFTFERIFHLAGILSSGAERQPILGHQVNVEGTLNILQLAKTQSDRQGKSVQVIFPSTIAVYGIPGEQKRASGKVSEGNFLTPITMYGINKLYAEQLGVYFATRFQSLGNGAETRKIDFRCVRLPGVVSAITVPTGGTSDYGPEMLHAAAKGVPYDCFVTPDASLPFMTMPDAVKALTMISEVPVEKLKRRVYNVTSFSITAEEFRKEVIKRFPNAQIGYKTEPTRLQIVESWPSDVDDSAARSDWGWTPDFSLTQAFDEYLVPGVLEMYAPQEAQVNLPLECANL